MRPARGSYGTVEVVRDTGVRPVTETEDRVAFAALVSDVEPTLRRALVAAYGAANLRVGAQLLFLPAARYGLTISIAIALAAAAAAMLRPDPRANVELDHQPA